MYATKAPFIWRKAVPGKRATIPAESTPASVYLRKKLIPFAPANSALVCSDCLALPELTRLSVYMEKSRPSPSSQLFVSHVNGSPSFVRKCRKRCLTKFRFKIANDHCSLIIQFSSRAFDRRFQTQQFIAM